MLWLAYPLIGIIAGFLAGFLGVGGGLVIVPALLLILSHSSDTAVHSAIATSLATMLFTSLSSIISHHRKKAVDWVMFKRMVVGLLVGAAFGVWIAEQISGAWLIRVFAIYALITALQMILGKQPQSRRPLPGLLGSSSTGVVIGSISSLVGIGGASLTVPWLLWHGERAQKAIATAAACGYPIALAGAVGFVVAGQDLPDASLTGYIHLPALLGIAAFSVLTAPLGAMVVHRIPAARAKQWFGMFMLVVGISLLI